MSSSTQAVKSQSKSQAAVFSILFAISGIHLLNDTIQVIITALFPIFEEALKLSYTQLGWLTFTLYMTSSVLQPMIGIFSDKKPTHLLLIVGVTFSAVGIVGVGLSTNYWIILLGVIFMGLGSAIFHPEGSKVVYLASGPKRGLAQSIYQVGGNFGTSLAPLLTLFVFVPLGQKGALWALVLILIAYTLLTHIVPWYKKQLEINKDLPLKKKTIVSGVAPITKNVMVFGICLLLFLIFIRSWYSAALTSYYQFFLRDYFGLTIKQAQIPLYLFLIFGVVGTFVGGILADRLGRKKILAGSLIGVIPITLIIPYVDLIWIYPLLSLLGFIMQAGFSVSVVYAQELMPGKVGMASGLVTGFAFGMGAVGAVALGGLADTFGLTQVILWLSYIPIFGLLALFLPKDRRV